MRRLLLLLFFIPSIAFAQTAINTLDQWKNDGSSHITQRVANTVVKITGLTTGLCLTLDGSSLLTTTACGSGGVSGGTAGMLPAWSSGTTLTSTSGPTAAYFYATSTKASTFPYASSTAQTVSSILYAPSILQASQFDQFIQANPTDSMVVGNLVQSGGVLLATTSVTLTPTQFCGTGEFIAASTTGANVVITVPNLSWIQSAGTCGTSAWSSSFAQQFVYNNSPTTTITETATDTAISFVYAPGTPPVLPPGGAWFISGQLTNEYSVQGFNAPNNKLRIYVQAFGTFASTTLFSSYGPAYFGGSATSSFSTTGALTLVTPLLVTSGGTGASSFTTNGNGVYYDGTKLSTAPLISPVTYPYASTTGLTAGSLFLSGTTLSSASTITIDANASSLSVRGNGGNFALLDTSLVSPSHTYTFPNAAGTFCLVGVLCDGGAFPFVTQTFLGTSTNATNTLMAFYSGFFSPASSTIGSGSEGLYINGSATTTGTASSTNLFVSKSGTSTNLAVNNFYINPITSALALIGADHKATAYGGAPACSANNFVTTISAVGGTTCGTATISGVNLGSNLNALTATNASLTFSGSYDGSAARTVGLNLGNENIWTASSTFPGLNIAQSTTTYATSTYISSTYILSTTANFTAATSTWLNAKFASSTNGWFQQLNIATTSCPMMLCVGATSSWGSAVVFENIVGTSTTMTIDWRKGNQQDIQMGTAAIAVGFNFASTAGQTLRLNVCNGESTAGAISFTLTGRGVLWAGGTLPTQTTAAQKCDIWNFEVTAGTSSRANPSTVILGAQSANF